MANSTPAPTNSKPSKPCADFPLYAHASGRWAKKIKGRTHFFGPWRDWQAALAKYEREKKDLSEGKTPKPLNPDALTVGVLVNRFLENREGKLLNAELSQLTFDDYKRAGAKLIRVLGRHAAVESLDPSDFKRLRSEIASRGGLVNLASEMNRMKAIFNFGRENERVDVHMGVEFEQPTKEAIRKEKVTKPQKIFTVEELRTLYQAAGQPMRSFMLLALNGGMGNNDIGLLQFGHIRDGWIDFPRPKTGVERSFPLWAETKAAIDTAKQTRGILPYVFITKYGHCWSKEKADNPISKEFRKLCKDCKLHQNGRGFYSLRHQFRTLADSCRDSAAIDWVMGHSNDSMAANYRHGIEPARLQAVVDHVRARVAPIWEEPTSC